ncbi:MAG: VanW family protein [Fimbriimonadaceae bacterium]
MKPWLIGFCMFGLMGMAFFAQGRQDSPRLIASFTTPLDGRSGAQQHNAQICGKKLDGTIVPAGAEFSFNKTIGPWSRDRGYQRAPVSYSGQLIDAWGGGVCQMSTTLYNSALLAGFPIEERNAHHYAPNYISPGRDAAVAYPNIDLRFKNTLDVPVTIHVRLDGGQLRAELWANTRTKPKVDIWQKPLTIIEPQTIRLTAEQKTWQRNPGKPGHVVETWRSVNGVRQRLSVDSYPVMNKVLDGASRR